MPFHPSFRAIRPFLFQSKSGSVGANLFTRARLQTDFVGGQGDQASPAGVRDNDRPLKAGFFFKRGISRPLALRLRSKSP